MYYSFGDFINGNSSSIVGFHVLTSSIPALAVLIASCRRKFFLSFHFSLVILFNIGGFWGRNKSYFICIVVETSFWCL